MPFEPGWRLFVELNLDGTLAITQVGKFRFVRRSPYRADGCKSDDDVGVFDFVSFVELWQRDAQSLVLKISRT
jgi:hypothetical protein